MVLLLSRTGRLLGAWVLCLAAATTALVFAWSHLNNPARVDGNDGHVNIDFGGQWIMGRLLLTGHAVDLYDRHAQQEVLARAFPFDQQNPAEPRRDHHRIGDMMLGQPDVSALEVLTATTAPLAGSSPLELIPLVAALPSEADLVTARRAKQLGGPLYPPIHAYVMAPLALLPPQTAYRVVQLLNLALVFALGYGASRWSGGRIWWPVASLLLMLFPGFAGTLNLGQNPLVTLALLGLGWWLATTGRPILAGIVWGCLAFKPVWAVTYFLVAVASRQWRFAVSMAVTGVVLIAVTLPLGGLRPWFDWLALGKQASALYERDRNWVCISRDVQNLPRRVLLDFSQGPGPGTSPYGRWPDVLGVGLLGGVVAFWLVGMWSWPPGRSGEPSRTQGAARLAAPTPDSFALLGAWLACWHFMYYDSLLLALPVFVLLRDPGGVVPWTFLVLFIATHYLFETLDPDLLGPPSETLLSLALLLWCWFRMRSGSARPPSGASPP